MPSEDAKVAFYKQQFEEIHHFDTLDWRIALILSPTLGAFFAVLSFLEALVPTVPMDRFLTLGIEGFKAFSIFVMIISFYGMWMVARNAAHLHIRVKVVKRAEEAMGVGMIFSDVVKDSPLAFITGRRTPLFFVYVFAWHSALSVLLADSVEKVSFLNVWAIVFTILASACCIVIHWVYMKTSLKK